MVVMTQWWCVCACCQAEEEEEEMEQEAAAPLPATGTAGGAPGADKQQASVAQAPAIWCMRVCKAVTGEHSALDTSNMVFVGWEGGGGGAQCLRHQSYGVCGVGGVGGESTVL